MRKRNVLVVLSATAKAADGAQGRERDRLAQHVRDLLTQEGLRVTLERGFDEAMSFLTRETVPVVIVLDEAAPDENGDRFLRGVSFADTPPGTMVISTGSPARLQTYTGAQFYAVVGLGYVPDALLSAPFRPQDLIEIVNRMLSSPETGDERETVSDG